MPAMFDPFDLYRERHHEMVDLGARQMARVRYARCAHGSISNPTTLGWVVSIKFRYLMNRWNRVAIVLQDSRVFEAAT